MDQTKHKKILIVAGEASGDLHAANMIKAAKRLNPDLSFYGVGGQRMEEAGCHLIHRIEELSVVGLTEVVSHLGPIARVFLHLRRLLRDESTRPDLLMTIDYQEFNLLLARQAQKAGVKVLHYVSPQVWAWRPKRVHRVASCVDALATLFPFEPELYQGLDLDVRYVGHPLLDDLPALDAKEALRETLGLSCHGPVVGIFPGSRRNEIRSLFADLLTAAKQIKKRQPAVQFVLPVASTLDRHELQGHADRAGVEIQLLDDCNLYEVAAACDSILCVSGTATLQVALTGTPMAIVYKVSPLTYAIGKHVVDVQAVGLPNIVAGKKVVPEFIQHQVTPEALSTEVVRQIEDAPYRRAMIDQLKGVKARMGNSGGSENVAQMALDLLAGDKQ